MFLISRSTGSQIHIFSNKYPGKRKCFAAPLWSRRRYVGLRRAGTGESVPGDLGSSLRRLGALQLPRMSGLTQIQPPAHRPSLPDSRKRLQGGLTPHRLFAPGPAALCCGPQCRGVTGDGGPGLTGTTQGSMQDFSFLRVKRLCCYKPKPSHNSQVQVLQELFGFRHNPVPLPASACPCHG